MRRSHVGEEGFERGHHARIGEKQVLFGEQTPAQIVAARAVGGETDREFDIGIRVRGDQLFDAEHAQHACGLPAAPALAFEGHERRAEAQHVEAGRAAAEVD